MSWELIRLCLDFGLLVLIWIIQLVVYPSFKYYERQQLLEWHPTYTLQITYIVLPLMFMQLLSSGIQLWNTFDWYSGISFGLVTLVWCSTFLQFVPLHNKISKGDFNDIIIEQLTQKNWLRTVLWTALFFISLAKVMS